MAADPTGAGAGQRQTALPEVVRRRTCKRLGQFATERQGADEKDFRWHESESSSSAITDLRAGGIHRKTHTSSQGGLLNERWALQINAFCGRKTSL